MRLPRILVTRSPHQASALADRLRALGAEPILIPAIELAEPSSFAPLDAALHHLDRFHWLLFTSANAVDAFHRRLAVLKGTGFSPSIPGATDKWALAPGGRLPGSLNIAAIGSATAKALATIGFTANLIPPQAIAESLADALLPHVLQPDGTPTRFLLIRAEEAREHLPETLRAAGADVTVASAYRTVVPAESIESIRRLFSDPVNYPDAITFTSASTARNLFALLEAADVTLPRSLSEDVVVLASIGPITSATLRDLGYPAQVESPKADITSLAEVLMENLGRRRGLRTNLLPQGRPD